MAKESWLSLQYPNRVLSIDRNQHCAVRVLKNRQISELCIVLGRKFKLGYIDALVMFRTLKSLRDAWPAQFSFPAAGSPRYLSVRSTISS